MSFYTVVSKLWQKINAITPYIRITMRGIKCLSRIPSRYRIYHMSKPVIFFLPCTTLIEDSTPKSTDLQGDVEENLSHLMTLARLALEKGDFERATAILEMGLKICEEYESYVSLPYIYDILASISFALGNMGKAEHILVSAMEKLVQIGTPDDDGQMVDFQLRLARIYSAYDESSLAEIGFRDCLSKQKTKILDGDTSTKTGMLYVNVLFWYGLHKIRNAEHIVAKKLITSAYDYSMKIKGLSPYQEMVILYTLADLHLQLGESSVALQNMKSAILLGKGIGSTDMPRCYLKLAKIYIDLNAWSSAKDSCQEAVKLAGLFNDPVVQSEAQYVLETIIEKLD